MLSLWTGGHRYGRGIECGMFFWLYGVEGVNKFNSVDALLSCTFLQLCQACPGTSQGSGREPGIIHE